MNGLLHRNAAAAFWPGKFDLSDNVYHTVRNGIGMFIFCIRTNNNVFDLSRGLDGEACLRFKTLSIQPDDGQGLLEQVIFPSSHDALCEGMPGVPDVGHKVGYFHALGQCILNILCGLECVLKVLNSVTQNCCVWCDMFDNLTQLRMRSKWCADQDHIADYW